MTIRGPGHASRRLFGSLVNRALNWGWQYECPFCAARLRRLLPFGEDVPVLRELRVVGGGRREAALCPVCSSSDRERALFLYLTSRTDLLQRGGTVLHVAPERHIEAVLRKTAGIRYVAGDLRSARDLMAFDLCRLPFRANSFDVVLCSHVLEHVSDDRLALRELLRIIKPGGWSILQVPLAAALDRTLEDPTVVDPRERRRRFGQSDHVRLYGSDYSDRLREEGFNVTPIAFARELGKYLTRRYGLLAEEVINVCVKS